MRHDVVIEGEAFRLRPVARSDAGFIHDLRTSQRAIYLHPTPDGIQRQTQWLNAYFERPDDYYFAIERRDYRPIPEGTIGLYNIDPTARQAEWGRWVLRSGSLAATESAWLLYHFGFDQLELAEMYCRTVQENRAVVSIHNSFGLETAGTEIDGDLVLVRQRLTRTAWPACADRAGRLVRRLAQMSGANAVDL